MTYIKRNKIPRSWPIKSKGTKYVISPSFNLKKGIPILIIIRDILKLSRNRKEAKRIIVNEVLINNKKAKNEKFPVSLFDIIKINKIKKFYKVVLSKKGKFELKEINEKEADHKISKIINKKVLKKKRIQINLSDGRNFLSNSKCKTNDSVKLNLKENKIESFIPLKISSAVLITSGKHIGREGIVKKINQDNIEVNIEKKVIKIPTKQIIVIK